MKSQQYQTVVELLLVYFHRAKTVLFPEVFWAYDFKKQDLYATYVAALSFSEAWVL